jgi:Fe-S-cluster containining protein
MSRKRVELTVLQPPPPRKDDGLVACLDCGKCCTYVAVGINAPRNPGYATDVLWYLYHENVYVYRDGDGEWSVHLEARCRNLAHDLKCRIYEERPHICRSFSNLTCEVNSHEGHPITFRSPEQFLDWLEVKHPKVYASIARKYLPEALLSRPRTFAPAPARPKARKRTRAAREGDAA